MQTLTWKENNISMHYFSDSKTINVTSTQTTISEGDTIELIISDCNSSNVTLHTGVEAKSDWFGDKYKYDGSTWSANTSFKGERFLQADINDSVTTINVGKTNAFASSGTVQIDDEKITYTGVDGTNLTGCTRGAESTSAASHTSNDTVTQI